MLSTVCGVLTTKPGIIEWIDSSIPEIDIITTKSYQVRPNPGNREPVVVETAYGCYGNAVGLRNPGMQKGIEELQELRKKRKLRALLNVSLSASSPEEFARLIKGFEPVGTEFFLSACSRRIRIEYRVSGSTRMEIHINRPGSNRKAPFREANS